MRLVVDYNSFADDQGKTLIKEVGIASVDHEDFVQQFMFKPAVNWNTLSEATRKNNTEKTLTEHGVRFCQGQVDYKELVPTLRKCVSRATSLYAFNKEKCQFLSQLIGRTFICLQEEFHAPEPQQTALTGVSCLHPCHAVRGVFSCALRNAHVMAQWLAYFDVCLKSENLCSLPGEKLEPPIAPVAQEGGEDNICTGPGVC